jgi:hypothetical protein
MATKKKKRRRVTARKWIQKAMGKHPGALHRILHVPLSQRIPLALLNEAAKAPGVLGRRARATKNVRNLRRKGRKGKRRS